MLLIISPAKTLDYATPHAAVRATQPAFLADAERLVRALRAQSPADLSALMRISPALGELNARRFADWHVPFTRRNARPALFAFRGEVYQGLDAYGLDADGLRYAQRHLRILSGLYGLLRPLDLIQPYRLEMGTRFAFGAHRSLYDFWGDRLTGAVNEALAGTRNPVLVNLASDEYFRAIDRTAVAGRVITPTFREQRAGTYRFLSHFGKRARGLMARWAIEQRIQDPAALRAFSLDGYRFAERLSTDDDWVFVRDGMR
ncbi:MAG: peroxide stress protein YaaA [Pseudomonadales bacterium]|nr:peroxide stress protein YaaA [Pseudomonadales bacterium]